MPTFSISVKLAVHDDVVPLHEAILTPFVNMNVKKEIVKQTIYYLTRTKLSTNL